MTSPRTGWILLVEDDPVFAMLFTRSWRRANPGVGLVVVATLGALRKSLADHPEPPRLVILDKNLPDGDGHEWAVEAAVPTYCWSSCTGEAKLSKPMGLEQLGFAVDELGLLIRP